jgi:hypothetical protein
MQAAHVPSRAAQGVAAAIPAAKLVFDKLLKSISFKRVQA